MFTPGPYAQAGIELAQQGRKIEALAYLRRAVTSEPTTPDVWLWLAHVTPDLQEYRNCVYQALRLQPDHPTARRMQIDLEYQAYGTSPPVAATQAVKKMDTGYRRQKRWRRLLILLNAVLITALAGRLALLASEGISSNDLNNLIPFLEDSKRLQFAVGSENDALGFEVIVPKSWSLADRGSPSWRAERDRLEREFPGATGQASQWREMQTDLGEVSFSEVDGAISKPVLVVETDSEKIKVNADFPANLTLRGVQPLPAVYPNTGCLVMGELAEAQAAPARNTPSFVKADVRARSSDDCIYYLEFEDDETHFWQVIVPVGADRLATWQITVPAALFAEYEDAINALLDSLRYREANSPNN